MDKEEIEKKLKASSINFVPDNLDLVIESCKNVTPDKLKTNKKSLRLIAISSVVTIIIMLFFGLYFNFTLNTPYDILIMETNPSIELVINKYDNVIGVNYLNDDAEQFFTDESFKNKKIDEAINSFIVTMKENHFFDSEESEIYLTLVSNHTNAQVRLNKFEEKANQLLQQNNVNKQAKCDKIRENEYSEIINSEMTPAKYKLIQKIIELDSQYTMENLSPLTLAQLRQILRNLNNNQ